MEDFTAFCIIVLLLIFSFIGLWDSIESLTGSSEATKLKTEAIEYGFAKWRVSSSGRTSFEWNTNSTTSGVKK